MSKQGSNSELFAHENIALIARPQIHTWHVLRIASHILSIASTFNVISVTWTVFSFVWTFVGREVWEHKFPASASKEVVSKSKSL